MTLALVRAWARTGQKPRGDLVYTLSRLAIPRWPTRLTPAVRTLLDALDRALGIRIDRDRLEEEANASVGSANCSTAPSATPSTPPC